MEVAKPELKEKKVMKIIGKNRNRNGTTEHYMYTWLEQDIEENIEVVVNIADEYYGMIYHILKKGENDCNRILDEREIFIKSALDTLNRLSLHIAIAGVDEY